MFVHKKNQKGIGLIEVIAALAISIIVITSLVSLSLYTLRSSSNNRYFQEATSAATKELELLRAYRDNLNEWSDFVLEMMDNCGGETEGDYCSMSTSGGINVVGTGKKDPIVSDVVVSYFKATDGNGNPLAADSQLVRVEIIAAWALGGDIKETHVYTEFTNWRGN
jgi:type II secretory pathway pseudopilin PulG